MLTLFKRTASAWSDANALRLSAALAYYSIFSVAPLLVLAVGVAGWFFGTKAMTGQLQDDLRELMGGRAADFIQSMVQSASQPSTSFWATSIGLVTLLIGASGVFGQLKDALNSIWSVKVKSGGWKVYVRQELLSFGMVVVIGFLLLVSFILTTLLNAFSRWVEAILRLPSWIWGGAGVLLSLVVVTLLFALIFKVLPDVKIHWRDVWAGAAFTAVLFEAGKFGLAYYLGRASTTSSFGASGSVVLILLWVYYASCIVLFGAEFTKEYALARGEKLQTTKFATPVPTEISQAVSPVHETYAGPQPAQESLGAIFPASAEPSSSESAASRELPKYLREHMAASILGGLGCGLAVGVAERVYTSRAGGSPEKNIRIASRMFGAAALVLIARYGSKVVGRIKGALHLAL
ncbi:ribonuclease BN [Chthoniobacter flavus Ellin428]|uniref:Ribonuclease BN n=2 Tax=Chthoniobacter flavus TaxID=191863 RepID=B4CZI2_9BACT|nr:ribonuclease BN [Chthoniobacter flavus Ellin428]TCO94044.1 membrane protein [Chthoniobacter flavus]